MTYDFMLADDISKVKARIRVEAKDLSKYGFTYQYKFDGERAMIFLEKGRIEPTAEGQNNINKVNIINRRGNNITHKFTSILPILWELANNYKTLVLDGEIIVVGDDKADNFNKLQQIAHSELPQKITDLNKTLDIRFMVFDILELDGMYVGNKPYNERCFMLKNILFPVLSLNKVCLVENQDNFEEAWAKAKEGLIAKRLRSIYQHKRSSDWLKIKKFKEAKVFYDRYELHSNEKGITLSNDLGERVSVGSEELSEKIKAIIDTEGKVYCEVQYLEKGETGLMRFPSFKRIVERIDYETNKKH